MKRILVLSLMMSAIQAMAVSSTCLEPAGQYTDKEMVLDQFVRGNGNPNWGDWCYDSGYEAQEVASCNQELDAWDNWLECSDYL